MKVTLSRGAGTLPFADALPGTLQFADALPGCTRPVMHAAWSLEDLLNCALFILPAEMLSSFLRVRK